MFSDNSALSANLHDVGACGKSCKEKQLSVLGIGGKEELLVALVFLVIHLIFESSSSEILLFPWCG